MKSIINIEAIIINSNEVLLMIMKLVMCIIIINDIIIDSNMKMTILLMCSSNIELCGNSNEWLKLTNDIINEYY